MNMEDKNEEKEMRKNKNRQDCESISFLFSKRNRNCWICGVWNDFWWLERRFLGLFGEF